MKRIRRKGAAAGPAAAAPVPMPEQAADPAAPALIPAPQESPAVVAWWVPRQDRAVVVVPFARDWDAEEVMAGIAARMCGR